MRDDVIDQRAIFVSMRACGGWHHTRKRSEKKVWRACFVCLCNRKGGREGGGERRARGRRKGCDFFLRV